MRYLLLLGFLGMANAVNLNGVECPVNSGELDCPSCPSGNVVIPGGVTSIASSAFRGCTGLTSVAFPSTLTNIGTMAFTSCSGITNLTFPSTLTSIGQDAFGQIPGLISVTFPEGLTSIGDYAFDSTITLVMYTVSKPNIANLPTCDPSSCSELIGSSAHIESFFSSWVPKADCGTSLESATRPQLEARYSSFCTE